MITILSMGLALCAAALTVNVGITKHSTWADVSVLGLLSVAPYLALCGLAWCYRRNREISRLVLAGTVVMSAVTAFLCLSPSQQDNLMAGSTEPPANCGPPIFAIAALTAPWLFVGALALVARMARSRGYQ